MLASLFGASGEWGLLIGRVVLGVVFAVHGYGKLFEMGVGGVAGFFESIGIIAPALFAWIVSLTEFFGGVALVLGIFARYAALGTSIIMVTAIVNVKWGIGLIAPPTSTIPGYELDLSLLALSLMVLLAGPGKLALERTLFEREI